MCVDVAVCMYEYMCMCVYAHPAMPCIGLVYSYVVWTLKERLSGTLCGFLLFILLLSTLELFECITCAVLLPL